VLDGVGIKLDALRARVYQHADENTVLSGLVTCYAGEHIACGGVQDERLDVLEAARPG
jgi:hypothetical protein